MDLARIDEIAHEQMIYRVTHESRETGYLYHHGRRTAQIALALADEVGVDVDRDVLYAAGFFHDIGKGTNPHNEAGAHLVRLLLRDACTAGELNRISQIVHEHCIRTQPNSYCAETRLVQDADLIDHIGAVGIWSLLRWSRHKHKTVEDVVGLLEEEESVRLRAWYRSAVNYERSREIVEQRLALEAQYIEQLAREHAGGL